MATPGRVSREVAGPGAHVLDLEIEDITIDGDGIARAGRLTVLVPFSIPGERVRVRLSHHDDRTAAATLLSIVEPSPHRVTPACRHFGPATSSPDRTSSPDLKIRPTFGGGGCGGCTGQHIAYPEQLRLKTSLVERLVRARVPSALPPLTMVSANEREPWGFRQKVHFVFGEGPSSGIRRPLLMGHFARGSRRVIGVTECPVHDARGSRQAFALYEQFSLAGVRAASGSDGALRSVVIRAALATSELMTTVVSSNERDKRLRDATRKAMAGAAEDTSFHLNVHGRDDGYIFGNTTKSLAGNHRLRDELLGTSYLMSPTSFFQTNVAAAALLVSNVRDAMPSPPSRVLVLYAGAGLFAIPLARAGHIVTAVESNRQALADGAASARLNRLTDREWRFIVARTEDALAPSVRADAVVLDPPRDGCAPRVVERVFGQLRPRVAAYVSCNPEALAEDLSRIVPFGYRIRSLLPVDMFPHTPHIETVAVLER